MKLYLDKKNLLSMMDSREDPMFFECFQFIRKNFDICYNFSKDEIISDPRLMYWFKNFSSGAGMSSYEYHGKGDAQPIRPLASNFYKSDRKFRSSVFLVDDDSKCDYISQKNCIAIGKVGQEIATVGKLIIDDRETLAIDIRSWDEYCPELPISDVIICDNYYFSSKRVYIQNDNEIIKALVKVQQSAVNLVLIVKENEVDNDLNLVTLQIELKNLLKDITGSKDSTVTILTTYAAHDRYAITNYMRVNSGCGFMLKGSGLKSNVTVDVKSNANRTCERISRRLLEEFSSIAKRPVRCVGDRVSNLLSF